VDISNSADSEPPASSWLRRTGQRWKVRLFLFSVGTALGSLVMLLLRVRVDVMGSVTPGLALIASLLGFPWLILSVRCPVCRRRVISEVFRKNPASWVEALIAMQGCPYCGSSGNQNR
jgi:hypothetical protein